MSPLNPYQSPLIPAEVLEPAWPTGGAYRDGKYLVLHHASSLPPICVKSGRPAEIEQEYELVGGGLPNDDSAPPTRKPWYGGKVYAIRLPLTNQVVRRARLLHAGGISLGVAMIAALFLWAALYHQPLKSKPSIISGEAVLIGCLLGLIVSVALLTEARQHLRLECLARGFFWISQARGKYLQQLPEWPVPRPSFWRRFLFGLAGVNPSPANQSSTKEEQ